MEVYDLKLVQMEEDYVCVTLLSYHSALRPRKKRTHDE